MNSISYQLGKYFRVGVLALALIPGLLIHNSALAIQLAPGVSVGDGDSVVEGDTGTVISDFTLTREGPLGREIAVTIETADGDINPATGGVDYVSIPAGNKVLIPANQADINVAVIVNGDTNFEADETFILRLTAAHEVTPFVSGDPIAYAAGADPRSVAVADIDGDGKPDIAVANIQGNNVSVLLGDGEGGFTKLGDYPAGTGPKAVAIGDLNSDGKPDLAVANEASKHVTVLINNGSTFDAAVSYPVGSFKITAITIADFGGDELPDIAALDTCIFGTNPCDGNTSSLVHILENKGGADFSRPTVSEGCSGPFCPPPEYPIYRPKSHLPLSIASVDINNDDRPDLVFSDGASDQISVLLNNGVGFADALRITTGMGSFFVAARDMNDDNYTDLAVLIGRISQVPCSGPFCPPEPPPSNPSIAILMGNGDGSFANPVLYPAGDNPLAVVITDLDIDGKPDLAVANGSGNTVSLLRNTGDGVFDAPVQSPALDNLSSIAAGDFNNDGRPDLVVNLEDSNAVGVLLNPSYLGPEFHATQTGPIAMASGDFNGDGHLDLVTADNGNSTTSVLYNDGAGLFTLGGGGECTTYGNGPVSIAAGDINGDGLIDVITAAPVDNQVCVYINDAGNPGLAFLFPLTNGGTLNALTLTDVNGDGRLDVAAVNRDAENVVVLMNTTPTENTTPSFAADINVGFAGGSPEHIAAADLNADGRPDLITTGPDAGSVAVLVNTTEVDTSIPSYASAVNFNTGGAPRFVAIGDLNNDGKLDLAVANSLPGDSVSVAVLLGSGSGEFALLANYPLDPFSSYLTSIAIGDLDADGRPDLAVTGANGNNVSILRNLGGGTFGTPVSFAVGNGPRAVVIGDFNGDGKPDLANTNQQHDNLSVLLAIQDVIVPISNSEGVGTILNDDVDVGDGDGDGDGDTSIILMDSQGKPITLSLPLGVGSFSNVRLITDTSGLTLPDGYSYPNGILAFDIVGLPVGGSAQVSIKLPKGSNPTAYVKCDSSGVCNVFAGAVISGNVVTLTLVDGGAGDADGVANGTIVDPGAPAKAAATTTTGGGSGARKKPSSGGGCAMGSATTPADPLWLLMLLAAAYGIKRTKQTATGKAE